MLGVDCSTASDMLQSAACCSATLSDGVLVLVLVLALVLALVLVSVEMSAVCCIRLLSSTAIASAAASVSGSNSCSALVSVPVSVSVPVPALLVAGVTGVASICSAVCCRRERGVSGIGGLASVAVNAEAAPSVGRGRCAIASEDELLQEEAAGEATASVDTERAADEAPALVCGAAALGVDASIASDMLKCLLSLEPVQTGKRCHHEAKAKSC